MRKRLAIWFSVIVTGFLLFAATQIPFQMGLFGGYSGVGLTLIGVLQAVLILPLLYVGLRLLGMDFRGIGWTAAHWQKDVLLGAAAALVWTLLQFLWIIPQTGGAERQDVAEIIAMLGGEWANVWWYLPLGIIGGGLVEELYNRGFFIGAFAGIFKDSKLALYGAAVLSIVFFAAGHLPRNWVEWIDLLIPSVLYTVLYLYTGRLTASIVAHALWNTTVAILVVVLYT
ncbi:CPBP family intramembrane glutamic endopeptidase [Planococcus maritimus]|uniref:CPBP family intramembrane glutamic endopeptidase n=1 Tax=Planococcus maritimus TaxID=192421 RepID=UPI00232D0CAA|nr:type II CAAX endopeptidase family protein [Planococcus maritimus]